MPYRFVWIIAAGVAALPALAVRGQQPERLTLRDAVALALRRNPSVAAMRAESAAGRAEQRAARAMTRPQAAGSLFASRSDMGGILASAPGADPPSLLMAPARTSADVSLAVMAPLSTGGLLANRLRAAERRADASEADARAEQADVALMVKRGYYGVLLAQAMERAAEAQLAVADEMERTARARFEAGKGIEAEVARARAEVADARRMLATARNDRAGMLAELKATLGRDQAWEVEPADDLAEVTAPPDAAPLRAEALRSRPEVAAAQARCAAAAAEAAAARGARRPQVYAAAMADAFAPGDMGRNTGYTVGAVVSLPLLDAGRRRAEVEAADAMAQAAQARLRALELRVGAEVQRAWLDARTAGENLASARMAQQAAQQAYDVALLRLQNQKAVQLEVLDAAAALTRARTAVAEARYNGAEAAARLHRAVGRGE